MPQRVCYIKLPYSVPNCEPFCEKLKRLVEKTYSSVNLRIAFTAPSDLSKNFKFKDKIIEVEKQSLVVYHIKCSECSADYIGKTERILAYRIKEHQSPKKDKKGNYLSSVYEHHKITGHKIDFRWNKNLRSCRPKNQSQRDTAYRQEKAKFKHSYKFAN